jgi:aerobic-type carbon monoxide dehydrogenase small subunit (CoxS/CutS family)
MRQHPFEFQVNGERYELLLPPWKSLARTLREDLELTGTKVGCGEGRCGSCTVLLDGEPVISCLLPICLLGGRSILTVEGLSGPDADPLQASFAELGAVQCGICTPGMLMTATALLQRVPRPTDEEVRAALVGNLCRCTGYAAIVEAVVAAGRPGEAEQ